MGALNTIALEPTYTKQFMAVCKTVKIVFVFVTVN